MAGIGVVGAGAWTGVYVGTDVVAGVYHRMQHCGVHDAAMHVRGSTPRSIVGAVLTARSMVLLLRPSAQPSRTRCHALRKHLLKLYIIIT